VVVHQVARCLGEKHVIRAAKPAAGVALAAIIAP